jgi:hypothetical protein
MNEELKLNRESARKWAIENISGKFFEIDNKQIQIHNSSIKSILSHYHSKPIERNELIYILEEVFKESIFINSEPEIKGRIQFKYWYYYRYKPDFFLNVVEMKTGEFRLYSITENIK